MRIVLLFTCAAACFAQTSSPTTRSGVMGAIITGAGVTGGVVDGEPYSAKELVERVQILADGTRIAQPVQTTQYYRDSFGRTRTEHTFAPPAGAVSKSPAGPMFIGINDPVAGIRYTLEPGTKIARQMITQALPMPPPPPPPPPGTAVRSSTLTFTPVPTRAVRTGDFAVPHEQFSRESLGTQTIEGVLAEGTRMTVVYPAQSIGNDRPITTTSESWISPELKVTVLSKQFDPRTGESTTRLTDISRTEPDSALFRVPADYKVVEPPAR